MMGPFHIASVIKPILRSGKRHDSVIKLVRSVRRTIRPVLSRENNDVYQNPCVRAQMIRVVMGIRFALQAIRLGDTLNFFLRTLC